MKYTRTVPPPLDIDDYREWKLRHRKKLPDLEFVRDLFFDHFWKAFEDPRPPAEREFSNGRLLEVFEDGKWWRLAFYLDEENWKAKLLTCFHDKKAPRFTNLPGLKYLFPQSR